MLVVYFWVIGGWLGSCLLGNLNIKWAEVFSFSLIIIILQKDNQKMFSLIVCVIERGLYLSLKNCMNSYLFKTWTVLWFKSYKLTLCSVFIKKS